MAGTGTATDHQGFGHDDEVLWLQPRSEIRSLRLHRDGRVRSRAATMTASLGFGALLAATSVGSALAPSAHASVEPALDAGRLSPAAAVLRDGPSMVLARQVNAVGGHFIPALTAPASLAPAVEAHAAPTPGAEEADEVRRFILAALGPVGGIDDVPLVFGTFADPNEVLSFGGVKVRRHLVETILRAAEATGADLVYMMALADKESSFRPEARARTSSAEGLFQFLNQTWLEMVRDHGAAHGLAEEAAAVVAAGGELTIEDDEARERVMGLRRDPWVSALMAGEMLKRDRKRIERRVGRNLNRNELYLAHFFGANAAGKFLSLRDGKPRHKAAGAFPQAARANRTLFYAQEGKRQRGLTVAEVHERIDQMIEHRTSRYAAVSEVLAFVAAR